MATVVYLSNDPSDISGYLKAYIGTRSPNATLEPSTTVTTTITSILTTTGAMTLTAGGSAAQWITAPLEEAVTISLPPYQSIWAKESEAAVNGQVALAYSQYTTSLQTAFLTTSAQAELTTTQAQINWISSLGASFGATGAREIITSTAFAAGDRLAIVGKYGGYTGVGTNAITSGITFYYNGLGSPSIGDTFVMFQENFRAGAAQIGTGESSGIRGVGVSYFYDLAHALTAAQGAGLIGSNASYNMIVDEATNQQSLV